MSDSVESKVKSYYEDGLKYKEICKLVGKGYPWVEKYIKENLVGTDSQIKRKESFKKNRYAPIKDLYELGYSTREISDRTGFQPHTITKYVRDYLIGTDSYLIRKGELDRPDVVYQIKNGYVDGLSYSDIAVSVGKSESFVEHHIRENLEGTSLESIREKNIIARYKAVNKDSIYDLIRKYYEMGLSLKEICAKVERGRTSVTSYINKNLLTTDSYRIRKDTLDKELSDKVRECYDKRFSITKTSQVLHKADYIIKDYYCRFDTEKR